MDTERKHFVFTLTPGRTGTAYLANLLRANLSDAEVHHEILGFDAFGIDTPDVSHMTQFNARGNTEHVRAFWQQKLERIAATPGRHYVETSHLLMKAGLVENLAPLLDVGIVDLIVLRRNMLDTVVSYRNRFDFLNKGNMWLWYLDPAYPRKIVDSSGIGELGWDGVCLWYLCEITARAEYYRLLFGNEARIRFHNVRLEDLSERGAAADLLDRLDAPRRADDTVIPPPANVSAHRAQWDDREIQRLRHVIDTMSFDPAALARGYIESGNRLGPVAETGT
jgi:hypothetical protein